MVQGRWALLKRRRLWNAEVVPRIFLGGPFLASGPEEMSSAVHREFCWLSSHPGSRSGHLGRPRAGGGLEESGESQV